MLAISFALCEYDFVNNKEDIMLIASAPTEEKLLKMAQDHWFSPNIRFEGDKVFNSKGQIEGVAVEQKKGRYRLVRRKV
jgi:hypothetical protein